MKNPHLVWIAGLMVTLTVILVPVILLWPGAAAAQADPWGYITPTPVHTDHSALLTGPYDTPQDVTRACLDCHPDAARQVMGTTHWTWESDPVNVPWRTEAVTIGKANQINNFCISAQGNQKKCTSCHAGYGWSEEKYDYTNQNNVDCLVCHADTSTYSKGEYGNPAEDIDLAAAAQTVRVPTRDNCGKCHFDGGGGNGVKHGDLDESLYFPKENIDVHMGGQGFQCTACHTTQDHIIQGKMVADNYTIDPQTQVACTDCHTGTVHADERLSLHTQSVACQTCHIPAMALKDPTKIFWDWSTAGQDVGDDHYTYLKIKGSFIYEKNFQPTYLWFNGNLEYRYLLGDKVDPTQPTYIDKPAGSIGDPTAKIFPFKLHIAKQPYDTEYNHLLAPITAGPDGYWTNFDWDSAFRLAEERIGLPYSGHYGFTETYMYWPTTHMVQPKENALQCNDCHGSSATRLDWQALGYPGDPMEWGGRFDTNK